MKRLVLAAVLLCPILAAEAQIYRWQDENNKTIISDRPPSGNARNQKKIEAEKPPEGDAGKTLADRDMEFRKRQKTARDNTEKAEKEQRASAEKQENCEVARRALKVLESGERVATRDSNGERVFMDDAQRAQEVARTRQVVQESCK